MKTQDLQVLRHAAHPAVVFDRDMGTTWLNVRGAQLFPAKRRDKLLSTMRRSDSLRAGIEAALGQSGAVPAFMVFHGETHRGTLRRVDGQRLLFEITPERHMAQVFRDLTEADRAMRRDLSRRHREAERLREARDRIRLATMDIVRAALDPLDGVQRSLGSLSVMDRACRAGLEHEMRAAHHRMEEARAEIESLKGLVDHGFLLDTTETVQPRALIGQALRDHCGLHRTSAMGVRIGALAPMTGNLRLARRLARHLVEAMTPLCDNGPDMVITGEAMDGRARLVCTAKLSDLAPRGAHESRHLSRPGGLPGPGDRLAVPGHPGPRGRDHAGAVRPRRAGPDRPSPRRRHGLGHRHARTIRDAAPLPQHAAGRPVRLTPAGHRRGRGGQAPPLGRGASG